MECVVFVILLWVGSALGDINPHHLCDEIAVVRCDTDYAATERDERVCGTDGKTYHNFCLYAQARCATPRITIAKVGPCHTTSTPPTTSSTVTSSPSTPSTTRHKTGSSTTGQVVTGSTTRGSTVVTTAGSTAVHTVDPIRQVFCATKDSIDCGTALEPLCASDKQFYLNRCEFSKALCDNPSLITKDQSACTS